MRKLPLVIFITFLFLSLLLQLNISAQNPTFRKSYDVTLFDIAGGMVEASSGDYIFAGGGIQAVLTSINNAGVVQWSKNYNSGFVAQFNDVKKVSTGGYILCGSSSSNGAILTRVDVNGNLIWSMKYQYPDGGGHSSSEYASSVIETSDGGFLVGGSVDYFWDGVSATTIDTTCAMGFKVNSTGTLLWNKVWPLTNSTKADEHFINDVAESSDGYFFVGESADETQSYDSDGDLPRDALIIKTDKAGVTQYIRRWGHSNSSSQGINSAITLTVGANAGKILLGGYDDIHAFLVTINGTTSTPGFSGYSRRINGSVIGNTYILTDIIENTDGNYSFLGTSLAFLSISLNTAIIKINSSTNAIMVGKSYAPIGLSSIIPRGGISSDGGYFTCQLDQQVTGFNFNIIRTDASGNIGSGASGCVPGSLSPGTAAYSPTLTTPASAEYTSMTASSTSPTITNVTTSEVLHCVSCVPPAAATTVTATPNPICAGQSTSITASGPATGVYYNVYTASTGGTNLGTTPLSLNPGSTTTYYIETVSNLDPTCVSTTRTSVTVTVNIAPTVDAGPVQTICAGSTVTLAGTIGGGASSASWSGGGGSYSPNANTLTAVYTPSLSEVSTGSVTLVLTTNDPAGPCNAAIDNVVITINPLPTVEAGPAQTICENSTVTLAGSIGGGATNATWSGGGGSYSPNANSLNAVYTPTAGEINAGSVTLTLTTNDPAGPCNAANDNVVITINKLPTVNAGINQTICAGLTVTLAGSIGTTASSATWSGGAGSFNPDANTLTAIYTPTSGEISSGSVTLTLTTNDPSGPCPAVSDNMLITINPQPTANAGSDQTICQPGSAVLTATGLPGSSYSWSYGAGNTATVTVSPSVTTTYTVSITDSQNCGTATANVIVNVVSAPVVNTNPDTICKGSAYQIMSNISNYASVLWSTSGTGGFSDPTLINPVYTPSTSDYNTGNVVLTVIATGYTPCGTATGNINLAFVQPATPAISNIGIPVCQNASIFALTGTPSGGTFSGTGVSNNQFNPAIAGAGTHAITYTISDNHSCTNFKTDSIIVWPLPTANAGINQTICERDSITLIATGLQGSSFIWSHNAGTTDTVVVIPLISTTYTVTVTDANNCGTISDDVVVTVLPLPVITASDDSICKGSSYQTSISITNYTSVSWICSGSGTFSNAALLNPVYTPSSSDISTGHVVLTVTASGNTPCGIVKDSIYLTILSLPVIDFSDIISPLCLNGVSLTLSFASPSGGTYSGTGVSSNIFNPNAAGTGLHTITYAYTDAFGCSNTATNTIKVNPLPNVSLSSFPNLCVTDSAVSLSGGNPAGGIYSNNFIVGNVFDPSSAGIGQHTINYIYSDSLGCTDTATANLLVVPQVSLSSDAPDNSIYVDLGQIVNFTTIPANQGNYVYSIDTAQIQSGTSNLFATNILESSNTVYVVLNEACSDSLKINVKPVPNAFVPFDNDGENDLFMPYVDLTIVNRWGEEIYKGNNGWDGKYKGQNVSPGTYFYLIKITGINGEEKLLTGTVTLVVRK